MLFEFRASRQVLECLYKRSPRLLVGVLSNSFSNNLFYLTNGRQALLFSVVHSVNITLRMRKLDLNQSNGNPSSKTPTSKGKSSLTYG